MDIILKMKFGSHLYGTSTPESDLDIKGIFLPSHRDIILGKYPRTVVRGRNKVACERNTKDDVDEEYFSLDRFLELLMEGQTVALDIVFGATDDDVVPDYSHVMIKIRRNLDKLLTRNVNAFVGYARQQAAKYGIKGSRLDALKSTMALLESLPTGDTLVQHSIVIASLVDQSKELVSLEKTALIEVLDIRGPNGKEEPHLHVCGRKVPFHAKVGYAKQVFGKILESYGQRARKAHLDGGVDWKALSHAVRVNNEALELLTTGKITFPRPEATLLVEIKTGKLPYDQVAEMIEKGLADLTEAHPTSKLRDEPDHEWAQDLIFDTYDKVVKGHY